MNPDFSRKTVDILAKRAAYRCSNPDCRTVTVGPNAEGDKAIIIGEAAHIHSARSDGPRYMLAMTDSARGEVTNGIWLCRNCHRKIDQDAGSFPAELMYAWREAHEAFVTDKIGAASDRILKEIEDRHINQFMEYPAIIRRIVIDRPRGWEWRLTAELLRYLNAPQFQRMRDLRSGLYTKRAVPVPIDDAIEWVGVRIDEMIELFGPIDKLLGRISHSWGASGENGNPDEIHRYCLLVRDALMRVVEHEESIKFTKLPGGFEDVKVLLESIVSSQAEKLEDIPKTLDEVLDIIQVDHSYTKENPLIINKIIKIEVPHKWADQLNSALMKAVHSAGL